ncbi:hypothetical protein [uncultured Clostridium sp.]|uniref:hypothetical protein n=1 Tax=uncultured Clostridium sp. TaxID=59620 RepID=UPI0026110898|nr:hypothetical protein [uncultured Clostridium sp.]
MSREAKEKILLIIENKLDKEKKCKCGRPLCNESLMKTEIENIFECPCGREYILIIDGKDTKLIRYGYGYKNGFKIYKHTYYAEIVEGKCIYSTENMLKESITFNIHQVDEDRKLTWVYANDNLEFLNMEKEDFFNDFTMEDLKEFKISLTRICERKGMEPNYGDLMEGFLKQIHLHDLFRFCKCLFGKHMFAYMISDGFSYLIDEDILNNVDVIEETLCIDRNELSLEKIWGIKKEALKYAADKKYSVKDLEKTKKLIEKIGYIGFEKLILEGKIEISKENKIIELLNSYYDTKRLSDYLQELLEEEDVEQNEAIDIIYEIYTISSDIGIEFNPYMENLREEYKNILEKYKVKQEKDKRKILDRRTKNIDIKQISHKYNCKLLRTVKDFKEEEKNGKEFGVNTILKMETENLFIASIRNKKEPEKILVTLKVMNEELVKAKNFGEKEMTKEMKDYLIRLAERNNWKVRF